MFKVVLSDEDGAFEVAMLEAAEPSQLVLFAAGGGGDPERHLPLMAALAAPGAAGRKKSRASATRGIPPVRRAGATRPRPAPRIVQRCD